MYDSRHTVHAVGDVVQAAQWYVSADGNDSSPNCGASSANPCETFTGLFAEQPGVANGDQITVLMPAIAGTPIFDNAIFNRSLFVNGLGANSIIDGSANRVISITAGVSVTLQNVNVRNGAASANGGAIWNGGALTLNQVLVENNTVNANGGGIYNAGTLTVIASTINGNTAGNGGGIYNAVGRMAIINTSTIAQSSAQEGGGIYNAGSMWLTNTTVQTNTAAMGGGIYNADTGILTLTTSLVSGNLAESQSLAAGGGIYNQGNLVGTDTTLNNNRVDNGSGSGGAIENAGPGTAQITGGLIRNNQAVYGGGIDNFAAAQMQLTRVVVRDNSATQGGGVSNDGSTLNISESAIISNSASSSGGGIYNSATINLVNVTLSNNRLTGGAGAAMSNEGGAANASLVHVSIVGNVVNNTSGAMASALYLGNEFGPTGGQLQLFGTLLSDNAPRNCHVLNGTAQSQGYNISKDNECAYLTLSTDAQATDPAVGSLLESNGTWTHAVLRGGSALDRIPQASCGAAIDQRGIPRPQLARCDVGAHETKPVDLGVGVSVLPATAYAGTPVTASVTLANGGGEVANGTLVTASLPMGMLFRACSTSQGTCTLNGSTIVATLGSVPSSGQVSITLFLTPTVAGTPALQFFASSNEPDSIASNDVALANLAILASANLSVSVQQPVAIVANQQVTYRLTVQNFGASPATSPAVTMSMPASVTVVSVSGTNWACTQSPGIVSCNYQLAELVPGAASEIVLTLIIASGQPEITIPIGVVSTTYDPDTTNNAQIIAGSVETAYLVRLPITVKNSP
jgi:uncharacterized repeat protein (TIGR01451 family)